MHSDSTTTDQQLAALLNQGDAGAFETIYRTYAGGRVRYIYSSTR